MAKDCKKTTRVQADHRKFLRVARIGRGLAHISLTFYLLRMFVALMRIVSAQRFQSAWIRADVKSLFYDLSYALEFLLQGVSFWMLLIGMSAALTIAVGTDLRYRSPTTRLPRVPQPRQTVVKLVRWLRRFSLVIAVGSALMSIPGVIQLHFSFSSRWNVETVWTWVITVVIGGITIVLQAAFWYVLFRFAAAALETLSRIEVNSLVYRDLSRSHGYDSDKSAIS